MQSITAGHRPSTDLPGDVTCPDLHPQPGRLVALAGARSRRRAAPHLVVQDHDALPDRLECLRQLGLGEARRDVLRAIPVKGLKPAQHRALDFALVAGRREALREIGVVLQVSQFRVRVDLENAGGSTSYGLIEAGTGASL